MRHCFRLQKYAGPRSRHTCPACGGKRCFTLYVDENGTPLAENVGRCDHESGCGYHHTPKEWFHEHPEAAGKWRMDEMEWRKQPAFPKKSTGTEQNCFIPDEIVKKSVRPDIMSSFTTFLLRLFEEKTVVQIVDGYKLGVTRAGDVIFFQIDVCGRCRTGKVMQYDAETGHRIKDEHAKGRIGWVHSLMKRSGSLPRDWQLSQCLFGEHLLKKFPDKPVALVESEKTAVICSAMMPEYVWLATGGKSQFNERLNVLKGRTVVAFPDVDGYDVWREKAAGLPSLDIKVSDLLQTNASEEERKQHIDIADWLIKWRLEPKAAPTEMNPTFRKVARYFSSEYHSELLALIKDFGLEVWW